VPAAVFIAFPERVIRPDETGNALLSGAQLKAPQSGPETKGLDSWGGLPAVELCRARDDVGWVPVYYDAIGIPHDNFVRCDQEHAHTFTCEIKHGMPQAALLVAEGWLFLGIWLAVNHKTQKG